MNDFPKANSFNINLVRSKIMGLNSLKLCEELLCGADLAGGLPFEPCCFDAVVSVDSYNYFGRDPRYLGQKLLPYVKPGGEDLPLHSWHDTRLP